MSNEPENLKLAIIGGTGALGSGLAWRALRAGVAVHIGSRNPDRARDLATTLRETFPGADVTGSDNRGAARAADMVALTVPFAHQLDTLGDIRADLAGKILIDATVPLVPPKVARVQLPAEGSAAVRAQTFLGDGVDVVSAFHNVPAASLPGDHDVGCDVLVFGDVRLAREAVIALISAMGMKGWHGGPLVNSAAAEALTSVLIFVNKTYPPGHAGIRIALGEG
ncbi:MAG: NADPH-dependent F420 reductase [Sphingomonadales bacterium]